MADVISFPSKNQSHLQILIINEPSIYTIQLPLNIWDREGNRVYLEMSYAEASALHKDIGKQLRKGKKR